MSEQEQADRLEWILRAHRENLTERSTAITDAQDRWLLCREVVRLRSELESLRAIVAHLPETGDRNPEDREPIVPGRRYWLKVRTDDNSWWEPFDCQGMLEQIGGHCRYSIIGETIESKCEVDDWPSDIFSRHPETGEAAESEGAQ